MTMFKTWVALAASLLVTVSISGCSEQETDSAEVAVAYIETFPTDVLRESPESLIALGPTSPSHAHRTFAFADYRAHTLLNENTISAPFDLQQLLSTLAMGADGTTLDAFSTVSGFDFNDVSIYAGISIWESQVASLASIERQNFLWGQLGHRFVPSYLQAQAELFGPTMSGMEFRLESSLSQTTINDTLNGELLMSEIGDRTRLVAAQTTKLATGWSSISTTEIVTGRFGEHETQRWWNMVRMAGLFRTTAGTNYQTVEVPLADPGLSIVMITPAPGEFDTVRNSLDAAFWDELRGNLMSSEPSVETTVHIPEFALERELLSNDMPDLGVALTDGSSSANPANSDIAANFSHVNNAGFLYLETPRQHISLAVDELGLSTSTVTAAVHRATENETTNQFDPLYFDPLIFDPPTNGSNFSSVTITTGPSTQSCFYPPDQRPFLFAIYATEQDTLLYLGQVRELDGPEVIPDWTAPLYMASCGISPWVEIYQYKGSVQCDFGSGTPLNEMSLTLSDAGIEVLNSNEGNDGQLYAAVCGGADGAINIFTIHEHQLPLAEGMGFSLLSDLDP